MSRAAGAVHHLFYDLSTSSGLRIACVAWRFWLLGNKGGRGQKNREEIGAGPIQASSGHSDSANRPGYEADLFV